eukprot:SAG11_NODE_25125_length_363_cov_1.143939_1_plen_55_part_01
MYVRRMKQCVTTFFNDPASTETYSYCNTLSLLDALPIFPTPSQFFPPILKYFLNF